MHTVTAVTASATTVLHGKAPDHSGHISSGCLDSFTIGTQQGVQDARVVRW